MKGRARELVEASLPDVVDWADLDAFALLARCNWWGGITGLAQYEHHLASGPSVEVWVMAEIAELRRRSG